LLADKVLLNIDPLNGKVGNNENHKNASKSFFIMSIDYYGSISWSFPSIKNYMKKGGHMQILIKLVTVCSLLLCAAMPGSADSKSPEKAFIVFDASGSMWGKLHGKTKIEIARKTVKKIIKEWQPSNQLGLIVYGHRTKGDCKDIEILIPLGPINQKKIETAIDGINPKGKTPLTQAVKIAAEKLKYNKQKATVIVVSDGKESCGLDPCGMATELENSGVNFTAHVIGFDITENERSQLRCLAENTGGRFYSADNASELLAAMHQAMDVTQREDGLSAYWSFDQCDARDDFSGNDGIVSGAPVCVKGVSGKAFKLNGKSDYVTIKNNGMGNLYDKATFGLWFKSDAGNFDNGPHRIYEKDQASYWVIMIDKNELVLYLRGQDSLGPPENTIKIAKKNEVENRWIFLTIVKKMNVFEIYINGKLKYKENTKVQKVVTKNPITFGRSTYWRAQYFTGLIDEIRFYTRALSPKEIEELYTLANHADN
jgi:Mg-chelatase subunit ChlD